ncbi:MAG: hypothetical protein ACRDPK_06970 [Carbonactinosporaceae bacterium]
MRLADAELWRRWWPRLELAVFMDRGDEGLRWSVTGELVGSAEVWLEAFADGTIVHYYLRAEPVAPAGRGRRRAAARLRRRYTLTWKRRINVLKDELEAGRITGMPPRGPCG